MHLECDADAPRDDAALRAVLRVPPPAEAAVRPTLGVMAGANVFREAPALRAELWLLRALPDGRVQLARLASGVRPYCYARSSSSDDGSEDEDHDDSPAYVTLLARGEGELHRSLWPHGRLLREPAYALLSHSERTKLRRVWLRNSDDSDDEGEDNEDVEDSDPGILPASVAPIVTFTFGARLDGGGAAGGALHALAGFQADGPGLRLQVSTSPAEVEQWEKETDDAPLPRTLLPDTWRHLHAAAARMDWYTLVPRRR